MLLSELECEVLDEEEAGEDAGEGTDQVAELDEVVGEVGRVEELDSDGGGDRDAEDRG